MSTLMQLQCEKVEALIQKDAALPDLSHNSMKRVFLIRKLEICRQNLN